MHTFITIKIHTDYEAETFVKDITEDVPMT